MTTCANCGAELAPADRFCGACGAARPAVAPVASASAGRGGSVLTWAAAGCGGLLLVLCILAVGALAFSDVLGLPSLEAVATQVAGGFVAAPPGGDAADDSATGDPTSGTLSPSPTGTATPAPTGTDEPAPPTRTPAPTVSAGPVARLRQGDARAFDDPPFTMAYANVEHVQPPTAVTITDGGGLWCYREWVSLTEAGDWIEALHSGTAINTVGVQLWGDGNDGWARVLVDGEEMWRGNVHELIAYLEVAGLGAGPHTVRVEALGIIGENAGDDVTVYFFGFNW